jgi:hypothetical protein
MFQQFNVMMRRVAESGIGPVHSAAMRPRPPVSLSDVFDDRDLVRRLAEANGPYWPVQRYFASAEEQRALSSASAPATGVGEAIRVGPVFRGDWANERPLIDGVEPILQCAALRDAARRVFAGTVVRPRLVYANLSLPMPGGDPGHTDVPEFRGVDRTRAPIWLLVTMGRSGLFEPWRVATATAVAWFYGGIGGAFTYWPDGPDAPPRTHPAATNTAIVGDNDVMFHRVDAIGDPDERTLRGLTLASQLVHVGAQTWEVHDGDRVLGRFPFAKVRISVSWKAYVFPDDRTAAVFDEHRDDLDLDRAIDMLCAALGPRVARPTDPLHDPAFVAAASRRFHRSPTVQPQ